MKRTFLCLFGCICKKGIGKTHRVKQSTHHVVGTMVDECIALHIFVTCVVQKLYQKEKNRQDKKIAAQQEVRQDVPKKECSFKK